MPVRKMILDSCDYWYQKNVLTRQDPVDSSIDTGANSSKDERLFRKLSDSGLGTLSLEDDSLGLLGAVGRRVSVGRVVALAGLIVEAMARAVRAAATAVATVATVSAVAAVSRWRVVTARLAVRGWIAVVTSAAAVWWWRVVSRTRWVVVTTGRVVPTRRVVRWRVAVNSYKLSSSISSVENCAWNTQP